MPPRSAPLLPNGPSVLRTATKLKLFSGSANPVRLRTLSCFAELQSRNTVESAMPRTRATRQTLPDALQALSQEVAAHLGLPLGPIRIKRFADGEIYVQVQESIRGCDVFLLQPTCPTESVSVNDTLMELMVMVDACRCALTFHLQCSPCPLVRAAPAISASGAQPRRETCTCARLQARIGKDDHSGGALLRVRTR